jgi:large conductance mechanosensitive channel
MLKGFRDFVMRGNVMDLAIAVVIGTAFAKVVDSMVSSIITPILNALPGVSVNGLSFAIRGGALAPKTTIDFSKIISSIIVFVLTAAVVYFVFVVPMGRIQRLRASGLAAEPAAVPEDILLLREIRDALSARPPESAAGSTPVPPRL